MDQALKTANRPKLAFELEPAWMGALALEWLKSHYWEPQRSTIPDIRREIRSRLHQMIGYMKKKQQLRLNHSQRKEKCSLKQVSKITMIIARLYSTYPYEVVSVLLEQLQSQALDPLDNEQAEIHHIKLLSSLVPWLLLNLKELKNSGQISIFEETQGIPTSIKFTPKISLKEILHKCLLLSLSGNKHLIDSTIFIAEMIGNSLLIKRVKGLHLLMLQNVHITADDSASTLETLFLQEQQSIKQAIEKFDTLKSRRRVSTEQASVKTEMKKKMWTVAKRWTPCPIGTLPCTFSSTPSIPVLDESVGVCVNNDTVINEHECGDVSALGKREPSHGISLPDNSPTPKKLKETAQNGELDDVNWQAIPSMKGLLLVDGIWRKVEEEELLAIESNAFKRVLTRSSCPLAGRRIGRRSFHTSPALQRTRLGRAT
ncbi:hypothetical protein Taro_051447 [Colocasia esculenta]|uniref:Uncharacterized protein n=1 Tax=Colocasia esculenta TaxID=4460 RepID=A0A843XFZ9_COLES|nr:hypothetical protein [Colocasia esculenta]